LHLAAESWQGEWLDRLFGDEALTCLEQMEELHLTEFDCDQIVAPESRVNAVEKLPRLKSLRTLTFYGFDVSGDVARAILAYLRNKDTALERVLKLEDGEIECFPDLPIEVQREPMGVPPVFPTFESTLRDQICHYLRFISRGRKLLHADPAPPVEFWPHVLAKISGGDEYDKGVLFEFLKTLATSEDGIFRDAT